MLKILLAGGLIAGLLGTAAIDPPISDHIVIDVVTINGTGCAAGTAAVAVSPDNLQATITYSNFLAAVGVGAQPGDARKNCQISLVVHMPQGQTYAIGDLVSHRGFASLAAGATAVVRTNASIQGAPATPFRSYTFTGPFDDDVLIYEPFDPATAVFAPCGSLRNVNINLDLRANAGTSDTKKTTSFIALEGSLTLPIVARPCPST